MQVISKMGSATTEMKKSLSLASTGRMYITEALGRPHTGIRQDM
jgi:hypothetical protein